MDEHSSRITVSAWFSRQLTLHVARLRALDNRPGSVRSAISIILMRAGLPLGQLAKAVDVSPWSLRRMELGETDGPPRILLKLATEAARASLPNCAKYLREKAIARTSELEHSQDGSRRWKLTSEEFYSIPPEDR